MQRLRQWWQDWSGQDPEFQQVAKAEEEAFLAHTRQRNIEYFTLFSSFLLGAVLLWWPLDLLVFYNSPTNLRLFSTWRVGVAAIGFFILAMMRWSAWARQNVEVFACITGSLTSILIGYFTARLEFGGYWPYGSLLLPLLATMLFTSMTRRILIATCFGAVYPLTYFLSYPGPPSAQVLTLYAGLLLLPIILAAVIGERFQALARLNFYQKRALQRRAHKLEEMDQLKSQFFANVTHELRTPLTLILGAFQSLQDQSNPTRHARSIRAGMRNSARLLHLIHQLLQLSQFDRGEHLPDKKVVDLADLCDKILSIFRDSTPGGQRFSLTSEGDTRAEIDPAQMRDVIYNLLGNAMKFSDADTGAISIGVSQQDTHLRLEVKDNGVGIAEDALPIIFERFRQADGSSSRAYEGTGVGLSLVKEIVDLHHGQISVQSTPAQGTTFSILLPRGKVEDRDPIDLSQTMTTHQPWRRVLKNTTQAPKTPTDTQPTKPPKASTTPTTPKAPTDTQPSRPTLPTEETASTTRATSTRQRLLPQPMQTTSASAEEDLLVTWDPDEDSAPAVWQLMRNPSHDTPVHPPEKGQVDALPSAEEERVTEKPKPTKEAAAREPGSERLEAPLRLLVVEDNEDLREYLRELLEDEYEVIEASDGLQGLSLAQRHQPALIVADYMMPKMDGKMLLDAVRDDPKLAEIPFLMLSAQGRYEVQLHLLEGGANDYLAKPFHPRELHARVHNLLLLQKQKRLLAAMNQRLLTFNRRLAAQSNKKSESLHQLARQAESLREGERASLAQDLHDHLGQLLTGMRFELDLARMRAHKPDRIEESIEQLDELLQQVIDTVRDVLNQLRPRIVAQSGLKAAIRWLISSLQRRHDLSLSLSLPEAPLSLPEETAISLFRILQEGLTNALKYAQASQITISLSHTDEHLVLQIQDDGVGFSKDDEEAGGLGLIGMKERTLAMHGTLSLTSQPDQGTCIQVQVPYPVSHPSPSTQETRT